MITIAVATLENPMGIQDPIYVFPHHLPDREQNLLRSLSRLVEDDIRVFVLFPDGWAGKSAPKEEVESRIQNYLTMCDEPAIVLGGATICNMFQKGLYKKYIGSFCSDFGPKLLPAPHFQDVLNSDAVCIGDLVLALLKAKHLSAVKETVDNEHE